MKRHRTDTVSFIFGLVFLLIAGWWAGGSWLDLNMPALGWLLAVGLIVFGALGLLGAVRGGKDEAAGIEPERDPRL